MTFISDQNISTVVGVVVSIPIFHLFSPEPWNQIQTYRAQSIPEWKDFKFIHYFKEPQSFPRGDNNEVIILDLQVTKGR